MIAYLRSGSGRQQAVPATGRGVVMTCASAGGPVRVKADVSSAVWKPPSDFKLSTWRRLDSFNIVIILTAVTRPITIMNQHVCYYIRFKQLALASDN